jgi:LacI family transcriptional regulator
MPKTAHPTLSQVAKKAGVGTTTVSRVINGGERVSPATLAHVRGVIESLGYVPNEAARTLKGRGTKTIGLVMPSIADPFFASCAEAVQAIARANDSLLIVTVTGNDPRTEIDNLKALIRHRVDGLIIVPANAQSPALLELLERVPMPVVAIDRPIAHSTIASVVSDNLKGAMTATEHLIAHGCKRILCLTGESTLYTIRERMSGYRKAMENAHLPLIFDATVKDYKSAEYAIKSLLGGSNPPDAIFSTKNSTTIYAFEVLQRLNIAVPESMALLGFDDFDLAATVRPSISVIQQPTEEMGRRAAEILFEQLSDEQHAGASFSARRSQQVRLHTRLIQRSSCGCKPQIA